MTDQLQQVVTIMSPLVEKLGGKVTITKSEFAAMSLVPTVVFFEEQANGDVVIELVKGATEIDAARKRHQATAVARSKLVVA